MNISEAAKFGADGSVLDLLRSGGFKQYTYAQEEAIKAGLCNGKSLVIAAPTSSGKTTIAEIAAVDGAMKGKKTVYLVTHKALAEEKYNSFKETYETGNWFSVSIATGDRSEGEWRDGILVATYEKYLALISSSTTYSLRDKIVIADELQIISDDARGSDVEVLLSIIRKQIPAQFIALSATAPNVGQIAGWFKCDFINVHNRDVPLRQEFWFNNQRFYNYLGTEEVFQESNTEIVADNAINAVNNLLEKDLGPVLVFTMTKPRAVELADKFSKSREQDVKSYMITEQLDLFSEPTGVSATLKGTTERKVAFHSTDLSFSERAVIEEALRKRNLDVVFATPTLAAGVNFPIRTVLFDSFNRFWVSGDPWISKSEYLNMSGRAGRLGFDEEGLSILLVTNRAEAIKANEYLSPEESNLYSKLFNKSIRKSVLSLISSRICKSEDEINSFYSETFWWHQHLEMNPKKLSQVALLVSESIDWLLKNKLFSGNNQNLYPTPLGRSISSTGLLPSTAIFLLSLLKNNSSVLDEDFEISLIHAICSSDEFSEENGQRFLPYARRNQPEVRAWQEISTKNLFIDPDSVENYDRVTNATYGASLWIQGVSEKKLRRNIPPISYGQLHALSVDISWIVDGLTKIVTTPGESLPSSIETKLNILAEKMRYGVTEEAIDILKSATKFDVPGLGRQRAMMLVDKGISEPNQIINATINQLKAILQNSKRARLFIEAVAKFFNSNFDYWKNRHLRVANELGLDEKLISSSYDLKGNEYENPISTILQEFSWETSKLDINMKQGMPDFMLTQNEVSILLECKTKQKENATITKKDAFAVLTKGADINANHSVTLGKPEFDTFSKYKASGSNKITLLSHFVFIEAYLLFKEGKADSDQIFLWLQIPGVASMEALKNIIEYGKQYR
ncbi:DEAD/DEAH box helicase [Desulfospira joergensenii]|uniref:DEAD/DEAH box helicase n=1 Tax=Desulfospira joergensenii TaxID=53329 RepID=UPI0003B66C9C|nr:DEAD/DEAH box helicase [Desulfospira joergensenii]